MNQGLFESLTGKFYDATPVESVPLAERQVISIKDNLTRIFNTREGLLPHLKGTVCPISAKSTAPCRTASGGSKRRLRTTIEKNEPRLRNVKVTRQDAAGRAMTLAFSISGEVPGFGTITFQTTFFTNGQSSIASWKKA